MFDRDYQFKGTHAEKVNQLTSSFNENHKLFKYSWQIYLMAPIIGVLYQKKADINNENGSYTNILLSQITPRVEDLTFNYRLIMLLDRKDILTIDERMDKAFRYYNTEKAAEDEKTYNQYVLGGVDILYDKLIKDASMPEDYINNLYDFMEELDERYNQSVDNVDIDELCRLAKG